MNVVSPIPAVLAVAVALLTCTLIALRSDPLAATDRFVAVDGLRGYLAFCVFLHHSAIWYFYLRSGTWDVPPSNLYTHFGQSGVALFFMITGFLFFSKILNGRDSGVDWLRLYVSRFLRLVPLYLVSMACLFAIVAILSGFTLHEPVREVYHDVSRWLFFTMHGTPDINGVNGTSIIVAGVTWSLPYEWRFYLMLPAFAWLLRVKVGKPYLIIGVVTLLAVLLKIKNIYTWLSFVGGMVAAFSVRSERLGQLLRRREVTLAVMAFLAATVALYPSAKAAVPLLALTLFFTTVASGNSFFGLFTNRASRILGEMAYGVYLLHGLFLFVLFRFVMGYEQARTLSPLMHWGFVLSLVPLLVVACFAAYMYVEKPALDRTKAVTASLRNGRFNPMRLKASRPR